VRGGKFLVMMAAAGLLATGCGTTVVHAQSPADALAAAVSKTGTQTTRIALTLSVKSKGMSMSFAITGAFDFAHSRGMLTMPAPIGLTEIVIAPKAYIKFTGAGTGMTLPHGKTWVEVDENALPADASSPLGPLGATGNPKDLLTSLTAIASSEQKLGTGTVRGVPATEYQLNIDPAKTASKLPASERASVSKLFQSLGKATIPVDIWLDSQNLVRRVGLSLQLPGSSTGGLGLSGNPQLAVTMDFYDYGAPVTVSAPPAAQVASMSQMISSGMSSASGSSSMPATPVAPPKVSGSLTPAQANAAGQAVAAFWAALGRNDPAAVARTVLPAQRSCETSMLQGAPKFAVSAFHVVSVQPAGSGRATVRFTVQARVNLDGQKLPISPAGTQWFVATQQAGHWYVDTSKSSQDAFIGGGPCS